MWKLEPSAEYEKRCKTWPKKYHRELKAMGDNLDTVYKTLCMGAAVEQLQFGFLHNEPCGAKAVDQKGGGQGLKQTRLYFYPDKTRKVLHLITIGDKKSQTTDINLCKKFISGLLQKEREADNG